MTQTLPGDISFSRYPSVALARNTNERGKKTTRGEKHKPADANQHRNSGRAPSLRQKGYTSRSP